MTHLALGPLMQQGAGGDYYPDVVLADSPDYYWRLQETSTATAFCEVSAEDGTYQNSPTRGVAGPVDLACNFDDTSNERVVFGTGVHTDLKTVTPLTMECFVNVDDVGDNQFIWGNDHAPAATSARNCLLYVTASGNLSFLRIRDSAAVTSSTTLSAGTWYHVAFTYDGTNMRLYIDGVLDATTAATGTLWGTDTVVSYIGYQGQLSGVAVHMDGSVAEFAIWKSALSGAQIAAHFAAV